MSHRRKAPPDMPDRPEGPTSEFHDPKSGYTFGLVWKSELPPGVESVRASLRALIVPHGEDYGAKALELAYARERKEPRDALSPHQARVLVFTALGPVGFRILGQTEKKADGSITQESGDGTDVWFSPPNFFFDIRFSEEDERRLLDRMFVTVERVRNFLAFSSMMSLPVVAVFATRHLLLSHRLDAPAQGYAPPRAPSSDQEEGAWSKALRGVYAATQRLLNEVSPETPLGRAIALVGEAICSLDHEERFFYAWRAIEVVGSIDLASARQRFQTGDKEAWMPYIESRVGALLNSQPVQVDHFQKVKVSLGKRAPTLDPKRLDEFHVLRNAIAHGDVKGDQHTEIVFATPELIQLAHTVVSQVLGEEL